MYKYVFFDLDGTLIDPKEGITKSVAYALEKFGIYESNLDNLTPFIGPPLKDSFMEFYHLNSDDAEKAIIYYRERFKGIGLTECHLYDNVEKMLSSLKKMGLKLVIATSKPEEFTIKILKNLDIFKYFDFVSGATFDGKRGEKAGVINYAIKMLNIIELKSVLMVGDRKFDILGAHSNNIDSCGVTFGYATCGELEEAKPNYLISDMLELIEIINKEI